MSNIRIVSCTPSTTDFLMLLGLGENIVGADDISMQYHINSNVKSVGPIDNINGNIVNELEPDIVIATETVPGMEAVIDYLKSDGHNVLSLHSERFDDLIADIYTTGVECGVEEIARDVIDKINDKVKRLISLVKIGDAPLRAYFEWYPDPFITCGSESWITDMLKKAGAANIFGDIMQPSFDVEEEEIIRRDPEVVFICWAGQGDDLQDMEIESILKRKKWKEITAIKKKQIYYLPESLFAFPGPKLLEGLELLIELVGVAGSE